MNVVTYYEEKGEKGEIRLWVATLPCKQMRAPLKTYHVI